MGGESLSITVRIFSVHSGSVTVPRPCSVPSPHMPPGRGGHGPGSRRWHGRAAGVGAMREPPGGVCKGDQPACTSCPIRLQAHARFKHAEAWRARGGSGMGIGGSGMGLHEAVNALPPPFSRPVDSAIACCTRAKPRSRSLCHPRAPSAAPRPPRLLAASSTAMAAREAALLALASLLLVAASPPASPAGGTGELQALRAPHCAPVHQPLFPRRPPHLSAAATSPRPLAPCVALAEASLRNLASLPCRRARRQQRSRAAAVWHRALGCRPDCRRCRRCAPAARQAASAAAGSAPPAAGSAAAEAAQYLATARTTGGDSTAGTPAASGRHAAKSRASPERQQPSCGSGGAGGERGAAGRRAEGSQPGTATQLPSRCLPFCCRRGSGVAAAGIAVCSSCRPALGAPAAVAFCGRSGRAVGVAYTGALCNGCCAAGGRAQR